LTREYRSAGASERKNARFAAPIEYRFSKKSVTEHANRFWFCPSRLVQDRVWADLWRRKHTSSGGGASTCILPILAIHSYPEEGAESPDWTNRTYLSRRRIAQLSGLDKDTVKEGIHFLSAKGLLRIWRVRHRNPEMKGYRLYYRLSTKLFKTLEEEGRRIPARLFYGGTWSMIPTAAARHLYVVIACLDPVHNEDEMFRKAMEVRIGAARRGLGRHSVEELRSSTRLQARIRREVVTKAHQGTSLTISQLAEYAGMQRSTTAAALKVLLRPMPGSVLHTRAWNEFDAGQATPSLVVRGAAKPRQATWYALNAAARMWTWPPELLNDRKLTRRVREIWMERPAVPAPKSEVPPKVSASGTPEWFEQL
jgi:hypothetical protein